MKPEVRKLLLSLGASLTLAACGGGSDDGYGIDDGSTPGVTQPAAVIKAKVGSNAVTTGSSMEVGQALVLDGASSLGGVTAYQWTLVKKPVGSQAELAEDTNVVARLLPDVPGEYQVSLTVKNGATSATSLLEFVAVNDRPVAVAPALIDALVGTVQLDGSGSVPPSGGEKSKLRYSWKLAAIPPTSELRALDATEANQPIARFKADVPGKYEADLVVSYDDKESASTTVVVNASKPFERPLATITPVTDKLIRGQEYVLDGSGSTSSNSENLQYRWTLRSLADGRDDSPTAPVLQDVDKPQVKFKPLVAGTYILELKVFDGISVSNNWSQTYLTVAGVPDGPREKPVAVIDLQFYNPSAQSEKNVKLQLNGRQSYNADLPTNDAGWTYEWTLKRWPKEFDPETADMALNVRYAYIVPTEFGEYEFEFRVQDSYGGWSDPVRQVYTVKNGANRAPVALAKVANGATNTGVGTTVTLDGSESSDADTNFLTYNWTLTNRPDGSQAVLVPSGRFGELVSFVADKAGPYTAKLSVVDSAGARSGSKAEVSVFAKSVNRAPQMRPSMGGVTYANQSGAIYDKDQPLLIAPRIIDKEYNQSVKGKDTKYVMTHWNAFELASNALDPDGDPLTYVWSVGNVPASVKLEKAETVCGVGGGWNDSKGEYDAWWAKMSNLRQWDCADLMIAPTVSGAYDVELMVSDGVEIVGPYKLSMQAAMRDEYPSALLEDLHTYHYWSNDDQALTVRREGEYQFTQRLFPYVNVYDGTRETRNMPGGLGFGESNPLTPEFVFKTFRLTAGDQDYTIKGLRAYDQDKVESPKFVGLTDGQVIPRGTSVEFQLVWPISQRPKLCDNYGSYIVNKNGMVWEFELAERPGWTFYFNPSNRVTGYKTETDWRGELVDTCVIS